MGVKKMGDENAITSQIQILDDIAALDNVINRVDALIQSMERLDSIANGTFRGINNASAVNIPSVPSVPNIPEQTAPTFDWSSQGGIDIFNGSGAERFREEMSALDRQMEQIISNQTRIDSLADNMDIIPNNMISDIDGLNQRILNLGDSIGNIERRRIDNIGADRVNNQIEELRGQLNEAAQSQTALNRAISNMDVSEARREYQRLNETINNAQRNIRENINAQNRFNNSIRDGTNSANGLMGTLKKLFGIYVSIQGAKQIIGLSDQMTQSTARLNMIVDDKGSVDALKDKIFAVAQDSRADYMQTMDLVGKLGLQAGKAFNSNDELLSFADQLNKQFAIAGTDTQGIEAATLQLTQALGSGVLRGEEFNSVFEQAPNIIQTIADYLGKDIGEMRDLAAEGKLTADIVKNALFYLAEATNTKFAEMPMTFSQIWTSIKNNAVVAFEPILNKLSEVANSEGFQALVNGIINGLSIIGEYLSYVFDFVCSIASFFSENWSTIGPIIEAIAIAVGIVTTAFVVFKAAITAAHIVMDLFTKHPIILFITAIIAVIVWLINKLGGLSACWELVKMRFQWGLIALEIAWNTVVASIIYVIDSLKIVMIRCKNKILNAWDIMSLGISTACTAIQNFMGDMKAGALKLLQGLVNEAISIINDFIGVLNKIPGVEIQTINDVTFGTEAELANEAAKQARNAELQAKRDKINADMAARDAELDNAIADREKNWNEAMNKNEALSNEMDKVIADGMAAYNAAKVEETFNESDIGSKVPQTPTAAAAPKLNSIDKVKKVDKVGGTVDVSSEDLKRMRDIYENDIVQEVYQSNITPQVNIQFGDVKETADVDKILGLIKGKIKESINIQADGVH